MSVFGADDAPCGVFGAVAGTGLHQRLTFVRGVPYQTSSGEMIVSFTTIGSWTLELQPQPAGVQRLVHGIVKEVIFRAFIPGNPDIRELDRCSVSGVQLEVTQAAHYGQEHVEIDLTYVGR